MTSCRFVQTVLNALLDEKVIWSHLRTIRFEYLKKNADLKCDDSFVPQENITKNIDKLSQLLGVKSVEVANGNFSKNDVNVAGKMFMYLNACPSFHVRLFWKVIYGRKSRIAMLASKVVKKSNDHFQNKAIKIMAKIFQLFGFQYITNFKEKESFGKNLVLNINATNKKLLQTLINHPVHILNNQEKFSSSSFIPFCSFGEEFIGAKINQYDIPVCNIFKPKIYFDQFCYETDLHELKDSDSKILEEQLEMGFTLVLDYNEERQILNHNVGSKKSKISFSHYDNSVSIYLDTISI